jgi:hypothetical protein
VMYEYCIAYFRSLKIFSYFEPWLVLNAHLKRISESSRKHTAIDLEMKMRMICEY